VLQQILARAGANNLIEMRARALQIGQDELLGCVASLGQLLSCAEPRPCLIEQCDMAQVRDCGRVAE